MEKGEVKVKWKTATEKEHKPPPVKWVDEQVAQGWPRAEAEAQWERDHPKPKAPEPPPPPQEKKRKKK